MKLINNWTLEKVCERIRERVPPQGCINNQGYCVLRNGPDDCCVVGAFIPDELYNPKMESTGIPALLNEWPKLREYMPFEGIEITKLQNIHDGLAEDNKTFDDDNLLCNVAEELINIIKKGVKNDSKQ